MAVESHTFLALTMGSVFVTHRVHKEGTNKSILVGTLLALLCQLLFVGDGVPVNLANILSGVSRDHCNIPSTFVQLRLPESHLCLQVAWSIEKGEDQL